MTAKQLALVRDLRLLGGQVAMDAAAELERLDSLATELGQRAIAAELREELRAETPRGIT